jgi:hypothetical protein
MAAVVHAQQPPPPPPAQTPAKAPDDLDRIKAALKRPNTIILTDTQVRFYVEIRAKFPSVEDMFRGVDVLHGPRAGGPAMTHAEYLSMVTPRDTIASSGGIKPTEALQFAVTNWLGQMLIRKALDEINNAKSEAEVQEIRDRITRELAALTAGRGGG